MAKDVYSIPFDLNKTQMDRQFQLQSKKNGIKFTKKPITMMTLVVWIAAILILMYAEMSSFIGQGSIFGGILFAIGFATFAYLMGRQDETHRYGYQVVPLYIQYVLKKARDLTLIRNTPLAKARRFFGVKHIEKKGIESGVIQMIDNRYARLYQVVGNASLMLFDEDANHVLDKTARFYKSIPECADIIFDTASEPQRVDEQLEECEYRRSLVYDDLLVALYDEQEYLLKEAVGGYKDETAMIVEDADKSDEGHIATHQYMMIIGDTKQDLYEAESLAYDDMNRSGYMFKYIKPLDYDEVVKYYKTLFT